MKKRLLLLVPCILLLLGMLTACSGGSGTTSQQEEQQIAGTSWSVENNEALEGLIDIDLPFDMGNLVTIQFDSNGTGKVQVLNFTRTFTWQVNNGQITLNFTGYGSRTMNFYLDGDSLVLRTNTININLTR